MRSRRKKTNRWSRGSAYQDYYRLNVRLDEVKSESNDKVAGKLLLIGGVFLLGVICMFVHAYLTQGIQKPIITHVKESRELDVPYFALTEKELELYQDYKIQKGDTLWSISKKLKLPLKKIKSINKMSSDNITVGQEIKIPVKKKLP